MRRLVFLTLAWASACQPEAPAPGDASEPPEARPREADVQGSGAEGAVAAIPAPVREGAAAPRLALTAAGTPLLSWTEPDTTGGTPGHALRYSLWRGGGWTEPGTAARGADWFVNWADTPGVVPLADGRLLAHWLRMHPEGNSPYAYDAAFSLSDGAGWAPEALLHDDGLAAEHGFVSAVPVGAGAAAVWLDGRDAAGHDGGHGHGGAMTLRAARVTASGTLAGEARLDARVCDCCPTALVAAGGARGASGGTLVAAYRDRSAREVRDIAVVRRVDGAWTEPAVPHADGWRIEGCPVNGPALAARGPRVALAWFTAAEDRPRVRLAFSEDAGATWGEAMTLDGAAPLGRVGVALLASGEAAVVWLGGAASGGGGVLNVQRVPASGAAGPRVEVARLEASRAVGVPVIVPHGAGALVAWTDPAAPVPVQTATVTF